MYNRSKVYLDEQGVFYKSQYGFRDKHSTQHAILDLISQIQTDLVRAMYARGSGEAARRAKRGRQPEKKKERLPA